MNRIETNMILEEFFNNIGQNLSEKDIEALKIYINGLIVEEEASINKIARNTVDSVGERTLNRRLHKISKESKSIFENAVRNFQKDPKLAVNKNGVYIIDEHIIKKSGKKIEGVDYFYSTADRDKVLGLSMISVHYYDNNKEYPITYDIFRRKEELERYGKSSQYKSKNQIARELILGANKLNDSCKTWEFDPYFFTKDNVKLLRSINCNYISKIKRNWKCTYKNKHYLISELQETISEDEYIEVKVKKKDSKVIKCFRAAKRDVYIKSIGDHLILFVEEYGEIKNGEFKKKDKDNKFILVTNMRDKTCKEIIELYMMRWKIETSYRDQNQNLSLSKCRWRNIEGQYCFIALVFLAYMLLCWAEYKKYLSEFIDDTRTLGMKKEAYKRYCQKIYFEWYYNLNRECKKCNIANLIYKLVHNKEVNPYQFIYNKVGTSI